MVSSVAYDELIEILDWLSRDTSLGELLVVIVLFEEPTDEERLMFIAGEVGAEPLLLLLWLEKPEEDMLCVTAGRHMPAADIDPLTAALPLPLFPVVLLEVVLLLLVLMFKFVSVLVLVFRLLLLFILILKLDPVTLDIPVEGELVLLLKLLLRLNGVTFAIS